MRIFLSGPMGSGKSTVGRRVAERLGADFVDLDAEIEARAGQSVRVIFRERGEAAFRALERAQAREVVERDGAVVVALGGGAVTDPITRRELLASGTLVTLRAPAEELARRVASDTGRPLLEGQDATAVLVDLLRERAPAYAEAHAVIETAEREPEAVAEAVISVCREVPVVVPLGLRTYRVEIGAGVRARLAGRVLGAAPGKVVVCVTDTGVETPWGEEAVGAVAGAGRTAIPVVLEAGEAHKTIASVERIWDAALDGSLGRDGMVVGIGGGVVGDLAGFAASTLLRGVALGQVPTTLLSMVDSAVGGKTGFDRVQGKNLVGTFHQPRFVLCDPEVLETLPAAERVAGLAEVVKSAWLDSEEAVRQLEEDAEALRDGDREATTRAIRMSVALKARIVTEDEHEGGRRRLLNLGHTVGHAIEAAASYRGVRHGEAVALGMVAAFRVAASLGEGPEVREGASRLTRLLEHLGLPTDLDARLAPGTLDFIASDKKRAGDHVAFVVPGAPGQTRVVPLGLDAVRGAVESA